LSVGLADALAAEGLAVALELEPDVDMEDVAELEVDADPEDEAELVLEAVLADEEAVLEEEMANCGVKLIRFGSSSSMISIA
jgi:hypothetical protein